MLTSLTLKNFRGQRSTTLTFGPGINRLVGPNEAGKTTVGHAIAFTYYGVDLSGTNRDTDSLITLGEDTTEVTLATDKATIHRSKQRGKTAKIKVSLKGLPPTSADQSGLTSKLGMSADTFLSQVSVGYFMQLPDPRKLEVIGAVAHVDRRELLVGLLPEFATTPTQLKLENLRSDLAQVTVERRKLSNQVTSDMGALAQIDRFLSEMLQTNTLEVADLSANIERYEAQRALHQLYRSELQAYKLALARAQDLKTRQEKMQADYDKAVMEQKALGPEPSAALIQELRTRYEELVRESGSLARAEKPLPEKPALFELQDEATCLRCGRVVTEKMRQTVIKQREDAINAYNQLAREIADHNKEIQERAIQCGKEILVAGNALRKAELDLEMWKTRSQAIKSRLEQSVVGEIRWPEAPVAPEGSFEKIEAALQELVGKKYALEHAAQKGASYQAQKSTLQESIAQKTESLLFLGKLEDALQELPRLEAQTILDRLKTRGVQFSLVEGTLIVTSDAGLPYHLLSTGRRMRADLAIASTLQSLYGKKAGKKAPGLYFLDDYDLLDATVQSELPEGAQILVAQVSSKATELEVIATR